MAIYTIKINEKSKKARTFIKFLTDYAQTNEDVSIEREHIPNAVTRKAIEDARNGKVERIENLDDFFKTI
ncbi:MAG: hypothetical protein AB2L24_28005 [Mangrovibacterium sp.]